MSTFPSPHEVQRAAVETLTPDIVAWGVDVAEHILAQPRVAYRLRRDLVALLREAAQELGVHAPTDLQKSALAGILLGLPPGGDEDAVDEKAPVDHVGA